MENFSIGVVISTYNNPKWLEKTLWGYLYQTCKPNEIIIADDGSRDDTRILIESFKDILPIRHVWHEDRGFQKTRILNSALLEARSDYLIFTDQDCIPRYDFVEVHSRYAKKGMFLSGGYFKLPMNLSLALSREDISTGRAFSLRWLLRHGLNLNLKCTKLLGCDGFAKFMNAVTPARATWNGCNSSGWRENLIAVNGFNEKMSYGGEDRELGLRMVNMGIKPVQIRFSAIALHLDHKRPYKTHESMEKNRIIIRSTKKNCLVVTPYGISQLH